MDARQSWIVTIGAGIGLGVSAAGCSEHATFEVASESAALGVDEARREGQRCRALSMRALGTYRTGSFDEGAAEIVAHDPETQRLFVVNAAATLVDVLGIADPTAPALIGQLDLTSYGSSVTSVAVRDGVVAVAVPAEPKTDPGHVVFVDSSDLSVIHAVRVGALPDMLAFTPNGRYVIVANEGEPSDDYLIDPEGSVSIIDLARGVRRLGQNRVYTAGFGRFARSELDPSVRVYGPNATPAQDFEPEYLTISDDSRTAWVTLQENNAVAEIDIRRAEVTRVFGLGWREFDGAGQGLDPSDKDDAIAIASWPVRGMYQPDAIASYRAAGRTYLITANEGEARDYEGYSDEARIADLTLDPDAFPGAAELQEEAALGRLKVTDALGDDDGDGDFDALYAFGARSFTIRSTSGALVYDSGDQFEQVTAQRHPDNFNADNTDNAFDGRSDDKGPEPEGVTIGTLNRRTYAFVGLERIGSVLAYDVTNPRSPCLAGYLNARNFAGDPELDGAGDLAPEGLVFISAQNSPDRRPLLVVANEVSGSTSLYELREEP